MTWEEEIARMRVAAESRGVDVRFIATIRKVEDGRPGREFGVLSVHAPNYDSQLREACISVAHRAALFEVHESCSCEPLFEYTSAHGMRYSDAFIRHFAGVWAPVQGADNDPTHLNDNWLNNAREIYSRFCTDGLS